MAIERSMYNIEWIADTPDFLGETLRLGLPLAPVTWMDNEPIPQSIIKW